MSRRQPVKLSGKNSTVFFGSFAELLFQGKETTTSIFEVYLDVENNRQDRLGWNMKRDIQQ